MKKCSHVILILILILVLALTGCGGSSGGPSDGGSETIYTAGAYAEGAYCRACYWTNNSTTPTSIGVSGTYSVANSICVSGGNIYTAGYINDGTNDQT